MESAAESGPGAAPDTGSSADREDADAGMGHLAGGRRRREPQTTTWPMPALICPAQSPTSTIMMRPWTAPGGAGKVLNLTDRKAPLPSGYSEGVGEGTPPSP